jgi:rare lipoprotein A
MTHTLPYRTLIRWLNFAAIFFAVMSISFLVEARDLPAMTDASMDTVLVDDAPAYDEYTMTDVPDGVASWYGGFFHGRRTASGRRFNMNELTAAHRSLPFGTLVRVQNTRSGEIVFVEITDRGPYAGHRRVIDLSREAARRIGLALGGVELEALRPDVVKAFYEGNDSTMLVIDGDMKIRVVPTDAIERQNRMLDLTEAMDRRAHDLHVVILAADKGLSFDLASEL